MSQYLSKLLSSTRLRIMYKEKRSLTRSLRLLTLFYLIVLLICFMKSLLKDIICYLKYLSLIVRSFLNSDLN